MKGLCKTLKGKVIAGAGITGVAGAVIAAVCILAGKPEAYRTISVEEVNGTSVVLNDEKESTNAYVGMHLLSGDDVTVQNASDMTLMLDMDKYVYAEENTHFWLEAEGDSTKSKTRIYLDAGAELNRIDTKLTAGEVYEVDTPNSVMAVRGTVFRVCVIYDEDGIAWTEVEVYQGSVTIDLKTLEGDFNGVSEVVNAGESVLIRAGSDFSEFVTDEDGNIKREIDYHALPKGTAEVLVSFIDDGEELCIGKELLMDYTELAEHKIEEIIIEEATCTQEGRKEIRCTVCDEVEETIKIPMLSHEEPEEWEVVREPDCTHKGQEQKCCLVCGEVLETRETDALGHTPGEYVVTQEATCLAEGHRVLYCTVCNALIQEESIPVLSHEEGDWQTVSTSTCTAAGEIIKKCIQCGTIVETSSVPALGHSYGAWNQTAAADCTNPGSQSRTCTRCGNVETSTIPALGHTLQITHNLQNVKPNNNNQAQVEYLATCTACQYINEDLHTITIYLVDDITRYYCEDCKTYISGEY